MDANTRSLPKRLFFFIAIAFAVTLLLRVTLIGYYNNNLGGIELNVVYGVQRLLLGQPLYQDPGSGSYAIIQYTPLWYYIIAGIAKLLGIHAPDVQAIFELCRVVALLCNLVTIGIGALILRDMKHGWLQSVLFSLALLPALTSHYYTRGDSLHLLLFAAGLWCYLQCSKRPSVPYLLLAALVTAACIMVKQSGILCFGIVLYCMAFIERRYFHTLAYILLTAAFTGLLLSLCLTGSSVHLFYLNAWLGLKNGIDPGFLLAMFKSRYFLDLVPCYFLVIPAAWLAFRSVGNKTVKVLAAGAVFSWLFGAVTGLKVGSSNNYFTEFLFFTLLLLPTLLRGGYGDIVLISYRKKPLTMRTYALAALIILLGSRTIGFFSVVCIEHGLKNNRQEYVNELLLRSYFNHTLHLQPGENIFFTERQFLDNLFIGNAIFPVKDVATMVYFTDPRTYTYGHFTAGMNNGLVKYIVTSTKRDDINVCSDSMPFVRFDRQRFRLVAIVAGYAIYRFTPV